mmetsp:Transcript_15116/g.26992  ORF Transcript_15116/g.26992 Transcript_15116/m.26992 type:complete len:406 (-) Transcript_15116:60-1277(-)
MVSRSALIRLARASTKATVPSASLPINSSIPSLATNSTASRATTFNSTPHHRSLTSNVTAAAADRRIAGRKRFYKNVGIKPCSPPEEPNQNKNNNASFTVESPISAGVDGTQSATGVTTTVPDSSILSSRLQPQSSSPPSSSIEWHTVTLDGRALRTPLGLPLTLPSLALALAVASEWDAQKIYLQPAQMPLMTLCCTAIDQVASDPSVHRTDVMRYLRNDTSCYWADPVEDRVLHRRQSQAWDGLHASLSEDLLGLPGTDVRPAMASGGGEALLLSRRSKGNPTSGLPHPPILVEKAKRWVDGLDAWTLTALYSACAESKSFFIGAALIQDAMKKEEAASGGGDRAGMARDGKWAAGAARIEEEFNIECWGLVEGGHDYDRLNCSIQMHAASFLVQAVAHSEAL